MAYSPIKYTDDDASTTGGSNQADAGKSRDLGAEQANVSTEQVFDKNNLIRKMVAFFTQQLGLSSAVAPHLEAGINGAVVGSTPSQSDVLQVAEQQLQKVAGIDPKVLALALPEQNMFKSFNMADANQNEITAQTLAVAAPQKQAEGLAFA